MKFLSFLVSRIGKALVVVLGVVIINFRAIPSVIALIFKSAFSPAAAAGGFAGATVRER